MKSKIILKTIVGLSLITLMSCNQKHPDKGLNIKMLKKDLVSKNANTNSKKNENSGKSKVKKVYSDVECESLLDRLVRGSDFNETYSKTHPYGYVIMANEINSDKVLLQLNKMDQKDHYIPDGWFELDMINRKLFYHKDNHVRSLEIKFNKQLVEELRENCPEFSEN